MSALRVKLKHKILKEVRLILMLIALPVGIIVYFLFIKPTPMKILSEDATYCEASKEKINK